MHSFKMACDVFAAKSQALTGQLIIGFAVALRKKFFHFAHWIIFSSSILLTGTNDSQQERYNISTAQVG